MKIMKLFYDGEYAADCENKMHYVKLLWGSVSINDEDVMKKENCGEFPYIIKIAKKIKENSENEYEYVKKYARFEENKS